MAYTDIDDSTINFNTVTYTGNVDHSSANGSQAITGVGFQPDWVWIKPRTLGYSAGSHNLTDSVRGAGVGLFSDLNSAEYDYGTSANGGTVIAFGSDGFTLGGASQVNEDSNTYVAWNWLAGGTASSNSDGSITSSVSVNTTAGFSIVSYTGTGSNATIGHGLGSAPQVVLLKERNGSNNWIMSHQPLSDSLSDFTRFLTLNSNGAVSGAGNVLFQSSAFTSSVFNVGTSAASNGSSQTFIAYCFAEKTGFSKFGKYTGNASVDGPYAYLGFEPAWVLIKRTDSSDNWMLYDNKRDTENPLTVALNADTSGAQFTTSNTLDFLSTGFKLKSTEATTNASGGTFIYMAFAQNPFVTAGTKAAGTAR